MPLKLKIAFNTIIQLLGKAATAGVTLLITILVARTFDPQGYGDYTKILTYIAPFYLISDFGLNAVVLRKLSTEEDQTETFFANLLGLRIIFSLLLIFLAVAILSFLPPGQNQGFTPLVRLGIIIFALTIFTQAIFTTGNLLFQKNLRYDLSVLSAFLGSLVTLALVGFFVFTRSSLILIVVSYIVGGVITALLALGLLRKFVKVHPAFNFSYWREFLWVAWPLGLTLVFNLIYFRADIFILTLTRPTYEVGIYGLAYKFFELPLTIPIFLINSIYPLMLTYNHENPAKLKSLVKKIFYFLLLISAGLVVFSWIFAPLLTLIKPTFSDSILAFRILALSFPLFFLSGLSMWVLITLGKQNLLLLFYGLSMVFNVGLNLIYIPQFGYLAAAVTTGLTEAVVLILTGWSALSILNQNYREAKNSAFLGVDKP